jgi:hypothetical protein
LEELESLEAIYGHDGYQYISESTFAIDVGTVNYPSIKLTITLPVNYPSTCPPEFEIKSALIIINYLKFV